MGGDGGGRPSFRGSERLQHLSDVADSGWVGASCVAGCTGAGATAVDALHPYSSSIPYEAAGYIGAAGLLLFVTSNLFMPYWEEGSSLKDVWRDSKAVFVEAFGLTAIIAGGMFGNALSLAPRLCGQESDAHRVDVAAALATSSGILAIVIGMTWAAAEKRRGKNRSALAAKA